MDTKTFYFLRWWLPFSTFLFLLLSGCGYNDYSPKPKGYFRIDLPPKKYQPFISGCPFTFEYHREAMVVVNQKQNSEPCWFNIEYPRYRATIHLSYKKIEKDSSINQLEKYIEDSRSLVYKHTVIASDIIEDRIKDDSSGIYGLIYSLKGNTASSMQFYITDSTGHFIRGALYFNVATNADSLSPVIHYIQDDILHLVNSFEWK